MEPTRDITGLLEDWQRGDRSAFERLVPRIESELRRIARQRLGRANSDISLTTTSLVQEAYVRLIGGGQGGWHGRAHFFALCADIMRGILVDHVRARRAAKRGGGAVRIPLEEGLAISEEHNLDLVAVDEALRELARIDPRKSRVIELRFFGGLTVEETAEVLSISADSVWRDWKLARMWLMRQMETAASDDAGGMAAH